MAVRVEAGMRPAIVRRPRAVGLLTVGVVLLLPMLGGCGDGRRGANGSDQGGLSGRTFLSETVTEKDAGRELVAGTRIRLSFAADGRVTATAGCNILGGTIVITEDRLVVSDLSTTGIGCDAVHHAQDAWLASLLSGDPSYSLIGDLLTVRAGTTTIDFIDRRTADPNRPLEGTEWQLDGTIEGDSVSSVPAGLRATLRIVEGRLSVDVEGCLGSAAVIDAGTEELVLEPLSFDEPTPNPEAAGVVAVLTAVLRGTTDYRIEASSLTITHPDGKGITLRAVV